VVTKDVPPHGMVVGNPARRIGWACVCGLRLGDDLTCRCGRRFVDRGEGIEPVEG
jgi:hypothetical protein